MRYGVLPDGVWRCAWAEGSRRQTPNTSTTTTTAASENYTALFLGWKLEKTKSLGSTRIMDNHGAIHTLFPYHSHTIPTTPRSHRCVVDPIPVAELGCAQQFMPTSIHASIQPYHPPPIHPTIIESTVIIVIIASTFLLLSCHLTATCDQIGSASVHPTISRPRTWTGLRMKRRRLTSFPAGFPGSDSYLRSISPLPLRCASLGHCASAVA